MRIGFGVGDLSRRFRLGEGDLDLPRALDLSDGFFLSSSFFVIFLLGLLLPFFDSGFLLSFARAALDESLELLEEDEEEDLELLPDELLLPLLELLPDDELLPELLRLLEPLLDPEEDFDLFLRSLPRSFLSSLSVDFLASSFLVADESLSFDETAIIKSNELKVVNKNYTDSREFNLINISRGFRSGSS